MTVWMVRESGVLNEGCSCPGQPVALFAHEAEAQAMVLRLEQMETEYTIERWEVPGLE